MATAHIAGIHAQEILQKLSQWGNVTTIILVGGSVFEFKGPFPTGTVAEGYYNLKGEGKGAAAGFEGHLNLKLVEAIHFQEKQHRGRDSYALVFSDAASKPIFKVFLGREDSGEIISHQLAAFRHLSTEYPLLEEK